MAVAIATAIITSVGKNIMLNIGNMFDLPICF